MCHEDDPCDTQDFGLDDEAWDGWYITIKNDSCPYKFAGRCLHVSGEMCEEHRCPCLG